MDDESRALKQRMIDLPNEELLKIIGPDSKDYRKEAIDFAKSELIRRGVPIQEAYPATDSRADNDDTEPSVCPLCRGRLRQGLLFAERELTIVFNDNDEERFVELWACADCGQVQLQVDFDTDVET